MKKDNVTINDSNRVMTDWQPMSRDEAEALWHRLESAKSDIPEDLQGRADGLWVVGEHGNQPVAVALLKDRRLAICSLQVEPLFARLPKISYSGGPFSLYSFLRGCSVDLDNNMACSEEDIRHLPQRLRRLFIHLATKPIPECRPAAPYDGTKETLSIKGAESVAGKAFRIAIKTAKPVD